jgi:hypothetical protein
MIVEHYSVDQGLPNNTVNCTLKDRDGFIWFGTWYGLCCFDGVKFKTFNKQEHDSDVPPRKIQRIVEDKNGYIWVKTIDRKLYVFNKVTECFHAVYDDMKNYSENIQVIKLQNTAEGDVLLLTKDKNLLLAGVDEKGQVTIKILFDSRDEINKHDYTLKHHVLCETEEYISWIGTDYKVSAVHKGAELASRPADFITSKINSGDKDSFTSFFEDGRKVWVGDRAGIFYSIDVRTGLVNRYVLSEIKGFPCRLPWCDIHYLCARHLSKKHVWLHRSTRKPGKIKVKAHVQFEGTNAPVATEIELESIPSELPFCYTEEETDAQSAGAGLAGSSVRTERMAGKVVLTEEERQKVLMEVERQQTEFGTEK